MLSNKYNKTDCPMPSKDWVENLNNLVKAGQAKVFIFDVGRPFKVTSNFNKEGK